MYKDVLQSIKNIDAFAIISLIIFFLFFAIIIVRLLRMNKDYLIKMKQLPLESENNPQNLKGE
jgi:cytochrome c oxidase cbb3-type subunit IV